MLDVITRRNHERHSLRGERGQALVEFALVLPLLLLVVLGIADFGRALGYKDDMTHLANAAARYAAVNNSPNGAGTLKTYITSTAPSGLQTMLGQPGSSFTFTFPPVAGGALNHCIGDPVTVTIQVQYPWLRFISSRLGIGATSSMTSTSTMRLEQNWGDPVTGLYRPSADAYNASGAQGGACP